MSFASISDIHIHDKGDAGWQSFEAFCNHPKVQQCTHIGLLGDIFDLMAGNHTEYIQRHEDFFEVLREWCESGKIVYFAEGNHDMHVSKLFSRVTAKWSQEASQKLVILPSDLVIQDESRTLLIGHGDLYNREDLTYLRYINFIKNPILSVVANYLMPYLVLKTIGERASQRSRKYGYKKFDEDRVRDVFRHGVEKMAPDNVQYIVGGHSHVTDEYCWDGKIYLNNGFPPKSKKFVLITAHEAKLVDL